jgi:hypothetical protein
MGLPKHDNGPRVLRIGAHVAALVALAALGAAVGDFASGPSALGAVGLLALGVLIAIALSWLYRPGGVASWREPRPRPAPEAEDEDEPRRDERPRRSGRRPPPRDPEGPWLGW